MRASFSDWVISVALANPYASQLYEDLLYYYQKNVRPVGNASDLLTVGFGASLIRIITVVSFLCYYVKVFICTATSKRMQRTVSVPEFSTYNARPYN